ncbi:MAG: hypothetical protein WCI72_03635 [archaeon]
MILDRFVEYVKTTQGIPEVISFGSGICLGYCNSKGIHMDPSFLGPAFIITPPAIHAMAATSGLEQGLGDPKYSEDYASAMKKNGVMGIGIGVAETGIGYLVGQVAGKLF